MARKRGTKAKGRTAKGFFTANSNLSISVISAAVVILILFVVMFASSGPASLQQGAKVAKYTLPTQVQKTPATISATPETASQPAAVTAPPVPAVAEKLPDLQVQVFSGYSGETKAAIRITTDVMNRGDGDVTSNYKVTYGYNKKTGTNRVEYVKVGDYDVKGPHKAGQTKTFAFLWITETAGVYDFNICADYENALKESNNENNCAGSVITVKNFGKYA